MGFPSPPQLPRQLFDRDLLHEHQKRTIDRMINPPTMALNFKIDGEPVIDDLPETSLDEHVPAATPADAELYGTLHTTDGSRDVWYSPSRCACFYADGSLACTDADIAAADGSASIAINRRAGRI